MDWLLPNYAERFASAGYAALIFDYRYFGESGGEPRQLIDVKKQREDLRNAITHARTLETIDSTRIVLWGTSMGGGHVIAAAAEDQAIAAVVVQIPGIDMVRSDARATMHIPAWTLARILVAAIRDTVQAALGLRPYYLKIFGRPDEAAVFTDQALKPRFDALMQSGSSWQNRFTPRFYLAPPRYREGTSEGITAPVLMCIAEREVYANPKFQEWVGRRIPRGEVTRYPVEHFDFYHGDTFDRVVNDQIAFLKKHVPA
jgi:fermentation-respiration switch protein FrsA (DUF1100 family)